MISFKQGERVIYTQADLFDNTLLNKKGYIKRQVDENKYLVDFESDGTKLVNGNCLELTDETSYP